MCVYWGDSENKEEKKLCGKVNNIHQNDGWETHSYLFNWINSWIVM